ncbi:MAG: hypothetical protein ACFFAU_07075, partial [Candidatus Hodarchaeota archaeon]
AEGFTVLGIFLQTPREIFPIFQEKTDILLMLKRRPRLQVGTSNLSISGKSIKALVDSLDDETNIVIITESKNFQEVKSHWKRFLPIVRQQINIKDFIQQESIEIKLINRLEDIRQSFETMKVRLKEK